jgi:hypothetical protein
MQGSGRTPNPPIIFTQTQLTLFVVLRSPIRLHMLARQHLHHPVLLRCRRPILLHRQRRERSSAIRQQVRLPSSFFYQEQAYRINGSHSLKETSEGHSKVLACFFVVNILSSNETCICLQNHLCYAYFHAICFLFCGRRWRLIAILCALARSPRQCNTCIPTGCAESSSCLKSRFVLAAYLTEVAPLRFGLPPSQITPKMSE